MSCADMILDSVGVAKLDEVNLSDMVVSGVIFPEFTWLTLTYMAYGYGTVSKWQDAFNILLTPN